jgi:hypothetical protein
MMASLTGRVGVLQKLLALPPPTTPEELAALRVASERYKVLIDNLGKANMALGRYIQGG